MLIDVKALYGSAVHATDASVGAIDEVLFDDAHWTIRYLVVNTGNAKVMISPLALESVDTEQWSVQVRLTRQQIEQSPAIETNQPVSRQWEKTYYDYYAWPYYWNGVGGWGAYGTPGLLLSRSAGEVESEQQKAQDHLHEHADAHLRSTQEVSGYGVSATDGHIGHIESFLVDSVSWRVRFVAVDTSVWWQGKKVLLPPDWMEQVSWPSHRLWVNVTREQVRNAPEWDGAAAISSEFEERLFRYYSQQRPPSQPPADPQTVLVATYDTHANAEAAVRTLQKAGLDMTKLSIVGTDYHTEDEVVGYYTTGDRMKAWGASGALWGGLWGLLIGSAFFFLPGIGPVLAAGPIVAWIVGALEGAAAVGGADALGAALRSIGIPNDRTIAYERQIKAGQFVVIAQGIGSAEDRAVIALESTHHRGIERHDGRPAPLLQVA